MGFRSFGLQIYGLPTVTGSVNLCDIFRYMVCQWRNMDGFPFRASAGRSSIRHWRKDSTNDEKKCNSFRQFDESIKSTYFK